MFFDGATFSACTLGKPCAKACRVVLLDQVCSGFDRRCGASVAPIVQRRIERIERATVMEREDLLSVVGFYKSGVHLFSPSWRMMRSERPGSSVRGVSLLGGACFSDGGLSFPRDQVFDFEKP